MARAVGSSHQHLPQARAGFEVSWLVHVLGVQAVASPHSNCLADVSFGATAPHRASMSLPAFAGSHGVQHRLDRVSMLRSCCRTSWSSRHVWAGSTVGRLASGREVFAGGGGDTHGLGVNFTMLFDFAKSQKS